MNKKHPIYLLLFPEHEIKAEVGDVFSVVQVDVDYDDDAKSKLQVVYLEKISHSEIMKIERKTWD